MLRFVLWVSVVLASAAVAQEITPEDVLASEIGEASKTRARLQVRIMQLNALVEQLRKELAEAKKESKPEQSGPFK